MPQILLASSKFAPLSEAQYKAIFARRAELAELAESYYSEDAIYPYMRATLSAMLPFFLESGCLTEITDFGHGPDFSEPSPANEIALVIIRAIRDGSEASDPLLSQAYYEIFEGGEFSEFAFRQVLDGYVLREAASMLALVASY